MRAVDLALSRSADALWPALQWLNSRVKPGNAFQPRWAPAALPRSWERSFPKLGWPRETLLIECVFLRFFAEDLQHKSISGSVAEDASKDYYHSD